MLSTLFVALLLAAGETPDATATAPAADAALSAPAPAAAPKPTKVAAARPKRLPDGLFEGAMVGASQPLTLRVAIVNGLVTHAEVVGQSGAPIVLRPTGSPGDLGLRFGGRTEQSFLKISGSFWDPARASGRFEGTLDSNKAQGTWLLAKR